MVEEGAGWLHNKRQQGWARMREIFYFKSQNHGKVAVDQERFLSQTVPGFCVQHSSPQREIQSSINTVFRGAPGKLLQENLCEDLLTSHCFSFCDLLSS